MLVDISPGAPSGTDLEYDPEFARMEKASQETAEQEFGSTKIEAIPADWETVRDIALTLLEKTHDLRIAVFLAQAELSLDGLLGFRDALQLIAGYTEKYWESVFPLLDEDDDNDPTSRINSLVALSRPGNVLRQLKTTPIVRSRAVGNITWTDAAIARGDQPAPAGMGEPPTPKKIDAAVRSSSVDDLAKLTEAVEQSIACVARIENSFTDRLGSGNGPNLEPLSKDLKSILRFQKPWLDMVRPQSSGATSAAVVEEDRGLISVDHSHTTVAAAPSNTVVYGAQSFNIGRREDAIEGLDKIIAWFERYEPSSPLPMLLKRAKRLSTMSFMEILEDISPSGIEQATVVKGKEPEVPLQNVAAAPESAPKSRKASNDDDY